MSRSPQPDGVSLLACHSGCRPDPARRTHHDLLLRVETDPDALVELFDLAVTWGELEYPADETIAPTRWPDFVRRHRWLDADRVERIFGLALDVALRSVPAPAVLGMAAGSGLCPALDPPAARRTARLTVAGR